MLKDLPSRYKAQTLEVSTSTHKWTKPHSLILVTASERLERMAAVVQAQRA